MNSLDQFINEKYCGEDCAKNFETLKPFKRDVNPIECQRDGCNARAIPPVDWFFCSIGCRQLRESGATPPALKDMKESLGARSKPDITHVRLASMVYESRAKEYGNDKYERANYLRKVANMAAAFRRYRDYLRADLSHTVKNLDSMEFHLANDPNLEDLEGMKAAAYSADTDAGLNFPASGLPHIAHGAASKSMAITQAVDAGLLPEDPGQPWKDSGD